MNLDDLLNAPLPAIRDDGFSVRILLRLEQARQRQLTLLWCIVAAAVLPVLWFLPLEQLNALFPVRLDQAFASPFLPPAAGILVLLWAWQARVLRF
jgi:hypothetical protein